MSSADMDKIIAKYDKLGRNHSSSYMAEIQHTHKRGSIPKDSHMITFMEDPVTPSKPHNESNDGEMTLRILDETERKLVVSERNYAEMCRKYEKSRLLCQSLEHELEKERKKRLQELIDLQNKFLLLETENEKNEGIVRAKQENIAILREKISQKDVQIVSFEKQLEEISYKLCTNIRLREEEHYDLARNSREQFQAQKSKVIDQVQHYLQKDVNRLSEQLNEFTNKLCEKQKQKQKVVEQLSQQSVTHRAQINQLRKSLLENESNYAKWLSQAKQEKLQMVEKYQYELQMAKSKQMQLKCSVTNAKIELSVSSKALVKQLEQEINRLQTANKDVKQQLQHLTNSNTSYQHKLQETTTKIDQVKQSYVLSSIQCQKLQKTIEQLQQDNQQLRNQHRQISIQASANKDLCDSIKTQNIELKHENCQLKKQLNKELNQLSEAKKQLIDANNNQLNTNSVLTSTTIKLKAQNERLELQLTNLTTDLYAERLKSAKLSEQIEETKSSMKRQFELSLDNAREEFKEQFNRGDISTSRTARDNMSVNQKQKMYLNLFALERKYELLKSEVVTVNDMTRIGANINKYISHK